MVRGQLAVVALLLLLGLASCTIWGSKHTMRAYTVKSGEYPFVVYVAVGEFHPVLAVDGCAGALISTTWVVCRSRCLIRYSELVRPEDVVLVAGLVDVRKPEDGQMRRGDEIKVHPVIFKENKETYPSVALVRAAKPFTTGFSVRVVGVTAGSLPDQGDQSWVVGWWYKEESVHRIQHMTEMRWIHALVMHANTCLREQIVQHESQLCVKVPISPTGLTVKDGNLLISGNSLLGLIYSQTNVQDSTYQMYMFVHLEYFLPWIREVVRDMPPVMPKHDNEIDYPEAIHKKAKRPSAARNVHVASCACDLRPYFFSVLLLVLVIAVGR